MNAAVNFLTDFGDEAVVLPLALAVLLFLLALRWWRGALAWAASLCATLGTILLLKIVFTACAVQLAGTGIVSPSGHTASSCLIYGGVFVLLARRPNRLLPALLCAAAIAGVFGFTRLFLQVHTPGDVMAGATIGLAGICLLVALAGERPDMRRRWPLAVAALGVFVLFHGIRLPAEGAIRAFALQDWLPFLALLPGLDGGGGLKAHTTGPCSCSAVRNTTGIDRPIPCRVASQPSADGVEDAQ